MIDQRAIVLDTWAGRRYYAVEVIGETPKKVRVRILTQGGVMLSAVSIVASCVARTAITNHAKGR